MLTQGLNGVSLINYKSKFPEYEMNNITSLQQWKSVPQGFVLYGSRSSTGEDTSVLGYDAVSTGKF